MCDGFFCSRSMTCDGAVLLITAVTVVAQRSYFVGDSYFHGSQ